MFTSCNKSCFLIRFFRMALLKRILKNKFLYLILGSLILGVLIGALVTNYYSSLRPLNTLLEFHAGGYKLINPLYECNNQETYGVMEFSDLENSLNDYINKITSKNSVTAVSVYFRDLNNGPWFGINEKADFAPSSLLKLPVMIAYFSKAQSDPSILSQKIKYDKEPEGLIPQNFKPLHPLELGKEYTVEQLIEQMIIGSDNVALGLLEDNIDGKDVDRVTLDLGIPTATDKTPENFMNVKDYSALFRVLFNASYLDREYSEKALEILSQAEFKKGIVDSIPGNITVAHKFGERYFPNGINQLHDCGIIYYPKRPYLLCVMTKGKDFNDLATTIQQISAKIYSELLKRYH